MYRHIMRWARLRAGLLVLASVSVASCSEKDEAYFFYLLTGDLGITVLGAPQGALVTVTDDRDWSASEVIGAQEYFFYELPAGTYGAAITPPDGFTCTPSSQSVEIPFDTEKRISFNCTPLTGTIIINVTGIATPIVVGLSGTATRTAQVTGTHRFEDLMAGTYGVSVGSVPGFSCAPQPSTVPLAAGQTATVNVNCTPQPGAIRVTVSGANALVTVSGQGVNTSMTVGSTPFTFTGLPAGTYTVTVTAPSGLVCSPPTANPTVQSGMTVDVLFACMPLPPTTSDFAGPHDVMYSVTMNTCGVSVPSTFNAPATFEPVSPIRFNVRFADAPSFPIMIDYDPSDGTGAGTTGTVPQGSLDAVEAWSNLMFRFVGLTNDDIEMTGTSDVTYFLSGSEFCRLKYNLRVAF